MTPQPPEFGREFTTHWATATYRAGVGWSDVAVEKRAEFSLDPSTMVFHYGQAVFEGLKSFRHPDGTVALFRPDQHATRLNRSAQRLALPALPEDMFVDACRRLVAKDIAAVPSGPGQSLYLRPFMFGADPCLGVAPAETVEFRVIASPVESYFATGSRPLAVWASHTYTRAASGGTGAAKCSGNYAGGLAAKVEAQERGCHETLWLDATERCYVEELGGMNFVAIRSDGCLVTPPPSDTILDGITRRSIYRLAEDLGLRAIEDQVRLDDLIDGSTFDEAFACGTAAVIAPIGSVRTASGVASIGDGGAGPISLRLREALVEVQEGRAAAPEGWLDVVG